MPDVLNLTGLEYCGEMADEVMIRPTFLNNDMERFFDVMVGIVGRKQLVMDDNLEYILQESLACERTPSGQIITLTDKFLEPCYLKVNLDQCAKGLNATFMERWRRKGNASFDLTGTEVATYILEKVQDALRKDVFALAWFGDTTLGDPFLQLCDGMWTRLIANAQAYGSNPDAIHRVLVPDGVLAECYALELFREMVTGADTMLDEIPEGEKYIAVTRSIYDNYVTCREELCCTDRTWETIEGGAKQLYFRGIPVYKVAAWDKVIRDKGLSNPHRAIYTYNKNLVVGTDNLADTNSLEILYNPYAKNNQIDAEFQMSTQFKYEELTVIAY